MFPSTTKEVTAKAQNGSDKQNPLRPKGVKMDGQTWRKSYPDGEGRVSSSIIVSRVLVTGGAMRIGKAISEAFADAGAVVRIHCCNSTLQAAELCKNLPLSAYYEHEFVQCDFKIADRESLRSLIKDCDIIINNASVYYPANSNFTANERKIQYKVNFEVPAALMELFFEENKKGCIINILDSGVGMKIAENDSYSQSKYDLRENTLKNAIAFAPNIRVNGVAPGAILPPPWLPESEMAKSIAAMPLKKAPTVTDVADTCVFLAKNNGVTGEIIHVDGGRHLLQ